MRRMLRELKRFYKNGGRAHLPWRPPSLKLREGKANPYLILVAEIMLQQTQVERVMPFYNRFIKRFSTAKKLAAAKLPEVLRLWQGLGYNRRAKYLHEAAKLIARDGYTGQKLPGVGPYTAGAIAAFAFNRPAVFVETNIRTVLFHSNASRSKASAKIGDKILLPLVAALLTKSKMPPREFYAAMMDYGAYLKKQGVKLNSRSKHYAKQSTFEGSPRQLRGAIVRELLKRPQTKIQLIKNLSPRTRGEIETELKRLMTEGLVRCAGAKYRAG